MRQAASAAGALGRWVPKAVTLPVALGVSFALHGLALGLHFQFPQASRALQDRALEIILVNSKSARKPSNAQALAQANLDGGGNVDAARRAATPLPPSARQQAGNDLEQARQRVQALESQQQRLLTEVQSKRKAPPRESQDSQPQPATPLPSGRDLATSALAMARMEAEIAKDVSEYNQRPRKKFIGTRADEYRFARYVEDWRLKVERVGTLNYPEAARGRLYGTLKLSVTIKADGSVDTVELERTSGHKVLDEAAIRIVRMAGPYAAFPADIRRDVDQLVITRTWFFTAGDRVQAQ